MRQVAAVHRTAILIQGKMAIEVNRRYLTDTPLQIPDELGRNRETDRLVCRAMVRPKILPIEG